MNVLLPLQVTNGRLAYASKSQMAIDAFIELLLSTPCGGCGADPEFGFIFNNLKFEIFNEKEGVIYDSSPQDNSNSKLYDKKVSGNSKNLNTFAVDLKKAIEQYEKRLTDVSVSMTYLKNQKMIQIVVEGILMETNEPYKYTTSINLWN